MKSILAFLFIIAIFAIAFMAAPDITNPTGFVVAEDKENKSKEKDLPEFRIFTRAICENISGFVLCHDEMFASCGNFEYRLPKNEVNGLGAFNKGWEDPRKTCRAICNLSPFAMHMRRLP